MNRDEIEFELDDNELRFDTDEDSVGVRLAGGDYGPPVDVEIDEPPLGSDNEYAMRFYELSQREFESQIELEREIDEVLTEMEREYFLGGLIKKIASGAGGALKKAASSIAKSIPGAQALKAVTQLAGSALKGGMLKPLTQAALSFVPGGSMVLPALDAMGFGGSSPAPQAAFGGFPDQGALGGGFGGGMPDVSRWSNLAQLFQDAFSQLAARTQREVSDPTEAMRLATESFQAALRKVGASSASKPGRRVILISPGEEVVIRVRSS